MLPAIHTDEVGNQKTPKQVHSGYGNFISDPILNSKKEDKEQVLLEMFNKIRQEHIDDKQNRIIASAQTVQQPDQIVMSGKPKMAAEIKSTGCQKHAQKSSLNGNLRKNGAKSEGRYNNKGQQNKKE